MLNSMTGFASREGQVSPYGKISVELRSANHKFLDIVFHLPEGFLSLEERVKRAVEARIKRGRVTCVITIIGKETPGVFVNTPLLKNYLLAIKNIKRQFYIKDEISLDTLMHLPGVVSLAETKFSKERLWPHLKILISQTLESLVRARQKEGQALYVYLKNRAQAIDRSLGIVNKRFKKVIREKLKGLKTDEERTAFLKESDITEEVERLKFHTKNFKNKLVRSNPVGKELDFIAQEMQREANTIGAKACNVYISARVVQIKSQIEKIREQVQNIE